MNYRRFYSYCLGEVLPKEIHVHHLDGNRENNDVINLVAIHKDLHTEYHKRLYDLNNICYRYRGYSRENYKELVFDDRFHYYEYSSGRFSEWYDGNSDSFLEKCQDEHYKRNFFSEIDEKVSAILPVELEISEIKKKQDGKMNHLYGCPLSNISIFPLSKKEQDFVQIYFHHANLPF